MADMSLLQGGPILGAVLASIVYVAAFSSLNEVSQSHGTVGSPMLSPYATESGA